MNPHQEIEIVDALNRPRKLQITKWRADNLVVQIKVVGGDEVRVEPASLVIAGMCMQEEGSEQN